MLLKVANEKQQQKFSAHTGAARIESLCRPGSVPSYVNGFGGTLAVTSPVPYLDFFIPVTPTFHVIRV